MFILLFILLFQTLNSKFNYVFFSFVVHYALEEKTLPNGRTTFNSEKQGHKYLGVVRIQLHDLTTLFEKQDNFNNTKLFRIFLVTSFFELIIRYKLKTIHIAHHCRT